MVSRVKTRRSVTAEAIEYLDVVLEEAKRIFEAKRKAKRIDEKHLSAVIGNLKVLSSDCLGYQKKADIEKVLSSLVFIRYNEF